MPGQENRGLSDVKPFHPQSQEAGGLFTDLGEFIVVVGLRGGSRGTGALSVRGLTNVAVRDSYNDFIFIVGDHPYQCSSSLAHFLSPCVAELHSADETIDEIRIGVEDPDELFGAVLEAARGCSITVDSAHRLTFVAICAALWNSEIYELICGQLGGEVKIDNVIDRLRFLWATR
jgi:hypothetical protein